MAFDDPATRDDFGYHDPGLGTLRDDWNIEAWCGRLDYDGDHCDLTLYETETGGFPDADPRPSGLARLRDVQARMTTHFLPRAIEAVIAARTARLNWRDGPPEDRWGPVEVAVETDNSLWLSVYEGETDEYSLWIVAFDDADMPREVRRTPYVAGQTRLSQAGRMV